MSDFWDIRCIGLVRLSISPLKIYISGLCFVPHASPSTVYDSSISFLAEGSAKITRHARIAYLVDAEHKSEYCIPAMENGHIGFLNCTALLF